MKTINEITEIIKENEFESFLSNWLTKENFNFDNRNYNSLKKFCVYKNEHDQYDRLLYLFSFKNYVYFYHVWSPSLETDIVFPLEPVFTLYGIKKHLLNIDASKNFFITKDIHNINSKFVTPGFNQEILHEIILGNL